MRRLQIYSSNDLRLVKAVVRSMPQIPALIARQFPSTEEGERHLELHGPDGDSQNAQTQTYDGNKLVLALHVQVPDDEARSYGEREIDDDRICYGEPIQLQ